MPARQYGTYQLGLGRVTAQEIEQAPRWWAAAGLLQWCVAPPIDRRLGLNNGVPS